MQVNQFCLLGFSKSSEEIIKSILKDLPFLISPINWVSANDKSLTGVIINASFLDTPQIQKYVKFVNVPLICAFNSDSGQEAANEYASIPSLDLRNPSPDKIKNWINHLLTKDEKQDSNLHANKIGSARSIGNAKVSEWSNSYSDLIEQILMKEPIVIEAEFDDKHTWIRPNKEFAYIDYGRDAVPGIDKWQWRVRDNMNIPEAARPLKIDLWLFESLWQADISLDDVITPDTYYKMVRWPQPLGKNGRSQALRLAAFAQNSSVNLDILMEKSGYDRSLIRKFIYAARMAGQLKKVSSKEAVVKSVQKNLSTNESQDAIQKRGLLNRFRAKLGL